MAAADPVADKSGFLCTYMSTHPDTLVAYVKHFGKIDGNGMDLEYKMKDPATLLLKSGSGTSSKPKVVRVEFDPPLLGYGLRRGEATATSSRAARPPYSDSNHAKFWWFAGSFRIGLSLFHGRLL
ncbi:hypothetical protein V8E52_004767 [Russula decolorans]